MYSVHGCRVSSWGDERFLELVVMGAQPKNHLVAFLKWVNFTVYEF